MRERLHTLIFGKRLKDSGLTQHKLGVLWGMPMFSSDTISTVSYSAEEILLVLTPVLGTAAYGIFVPIVAGNRLYAGRRSQRQRGCGRSNVETNLRRALQLSQGSFTPFFTRPVSCILLIITLIIVVRTVWSQAKDRKAAKAAAEAKEG